MHHSTTFLPLLLALYFTSAHDNIPPTHRRHLARALQKETQRKLVARAGAAYSNETIDEIASASAHSTTLVAAESAVSTVSSADAGSISNVVQSSAQSTIQNVVSTATASVVPASSAAVSPSETEESIAPISFAAPSTVQIVSAVAPTSSAVGPETLSSLAPGTTTVIRSARPSIVTSLLTSGRPSASAASANENTTESKGGLSKSALIIIIVVASVVGAAAIGWTTFRKWKLRPSNRFDRKLKPIDFSPHNDGLGDDFLEKTMQRSPSNASLDRQRQQFVVDLETEPNHVPGIPEHDFTAGSNATGYVAAPYNQDVYNADPFAHAQAYDYDQGYYVQQRHQYEAQHGCSEHDYPTQDQHAHEGYADLQRGNSVGSGSGSGHGHGHGCQQYVQPSDFPNPNTYLGRPTGGGDGPYAQAVNYRV